MNMQDKRKHLNLKQTTSYEVQKNANIWMNYLNMTYQNAYNY